jgi:hypothetical protein
MQHSWRREWQSRCRDADVRGQTSPFLFPLRVCLQGAWYLRGPSLRPEQPSQPRSGVWGRTGRFWGKAGDARWRASGATGSQLRFNVDTARRLISMGQQRPQGNRFRGGDIGRRPFDGVAQVGELPCHAGNGEVDQSGMGDGSSRLPPLTDRNRTDGTSSAVVRCPVGSGDQSIIRTRRKIRSPSSGLVGDGSSFPLKTRVAPVGSYFAGAGCMTRWPSGTPMAGSGGRPPSSILGARSNPTFETKALKP